MSEPARDLRLEARLMQAGSETVSNTQKNMKKGTTPKWEIKDLYFDKDGCLCVQNPELAREIMTVMKAWGNRLRIYTWVDSKRPATDAYLDVGKDGGGTTSEMGHPVNMMCPCTEG